MKYTSSQERAIVEFKEWMKSSHLLATLSGSAGTGKTTIVKELVAQMPELNVAFTAPTNKATKVIRETMLEGLEPKSRAAQKIEASCFTIHKANSLVLMDDAEQKYLTQKGESDFGSFDLIVVDEASMIGRRMFDLIQSESANSDVKILFVGDPFQLEPVRDGHPAAFSEIEVPTQLYLSEIVRQAKGSDIIEQGQIFRRLIEGTSNEVPRFIQSKAGEQGIHILKGSAFRERFSNAVKEGQDVRSIAWTNARVAQMAFEVRAALFGDLEATMFQKGERVFAAAPVHGDSDLDSMYTDQEAIIYSVEESESHPDYPAFQTIPLMLHDTDRDRMISVRICHPSDVERKEKHAAKLKKKAIDAKVKGRYSGQLFKQWHEFKDSFHDIRSVHAITTHRSQGSTFEDVYIDVSDIRRNRKEQERYRLLYVAVTRARSNVYLKMG